MSMRELLIQTRYYFLYLSLGVSRSYIPNDQKIQKTTKLFTNMV